MAQTARVPWYRKNRWWALIAAPVVVFFLVFYAFDPLVDWGTRKLFSKVKGYTITFDDARLVPKGPVFSLTKLKVMKRSAGGEKKPMLYARQFDVGILWREVLHGNFVGSARLEGMKVNLIAADEKAEQQAQDDFPDLAKQLLELAPLRVDRFEVKNGEITFTDRTKKEVPQLWLHDMETTVENVSTRAALARGEPTVVALSAKIQRKGELSVYVTADPLAKGLWFSGKVSAVGLDVREFHDLIASRTGLALSSGTLDVLMEFDCRGNELTGGVKPILKNAEVVQAKPGIDNWFKKVLADATLDIFSDRVPGRNAVATRIPIEGRLDEPGLQLWPTILGVVRNAFVEGISTSFDDLPPPKAPEKEGLIDQAKDALDKKEKEAPKAQPDNT
jgi:hypothetical protein